MMSFFLINVLYLMLAIAWDKVLLIVQKNYQFGPAV